MQTKFGFVFVDESALNGDKEAQEKLFPKRATIHSSGFDLASSSREKILIRKGERELVPTGIAIGLSDGYEAQVRPRSGLALKHGVTVLNAPGTIDADYRGEIRVILINHGEQDFWIEYGMRVAQLVIARVEMAELVLESQVNDTQRGSKGFGSSGLM